MNINLAADLDIREFLGTGITRYDSGMTNCILRVKNGAVEVTQRPSIDISEDSSTISGLNDRARGIYYWETNSKIYIVHDNDIYEATQDSARITENSGTFSTGTERVTILETIGTPRLVFIDAENDKLFVMTSSKLLDQVTTNVPSTITHGGVILNGFLFIMDEDGVIYNSDADAPQTFGATSFLEAERENDKGVYLGKQSDHIVAFGTRTIEFFYYAGNQSGSPLNRREGLMHNIGCADGQGVWENGDIIYFLGSSPTGEIAVYKLENFMPVPISGDTLNSYLTQGITQENIRVNLCGWSSMGHIVLVMTIYTLTGTAPGSIVPKQTLCYDTASGKWGFISTSANSHTLFPLMAFTKRTGGQNATVSARPGEGIFYNGDIINLNDKLLPIDTLLGSDGILEADIVEADIVAAGASDVGTNIDMTIRTGQSDYGVTGYKYQGRTAIQGDSTETAQTLTLRHSNEDADNFNTGVSIDMASYKKATYRGGRFVRRNYQLEYSGDEQIFLRSLDVDMEAG